MQRKTKKDTWWNWKHTRKQMPIEPSWRSKQKGREKVSSYILFNSYTYTWHTHTLLYNPTPVGIPLSAPPVNVFFGRGSVSEGTKWSVSYHCSCNFLLVVGCVATFSNRFIILSFIFWHENENVNITARIIPKDNAAIFSDTQRDY